MAVDCLGPVCGGLCPLWTFHYVRVFVFMEQFGVQVNYVAAIVRRVWGGRAATVFSYVSQ